MKTTMLKGVEGVMRGYRPQVDWGGEGGSATIMMGRHNVKVATAGWRRRCIFIFLATLLIISVLNFILTCWILRKIHFNAEGVGDLLVRAHAIEIQGKTQTEKGIFASQVKGKKNKKFGITGYYNLSATILSSEGDSKSQLILDPEFLSGVSEEFRVSDSEGRMLYEANEESANVGAKHFTVIGGLGATFDGTVQTPRLLGDSIDEFRIESGTRSVMGKAVNSIRVETRAGDVNSISLDDQYFHSEKGHIRFAGSNVQLPNIPIESSSSSSQPETQIPPSVAKSPDVNEDVSETKITVFQVCVCANGKLFLYPDEQICQDEQELCRP